MEEVDGIICSSLEQIGCDVGQGLNALTPELFLKIVTECVQEIQPEIAVPNSLPENITKRFVIASNFAEVCTNLGYQNDIGYHTFLYPNIVDVRRLLMFLISRFPNRNRSQDTSDCNQIIDDKYDVLRIQTSKDILKSLSSVWIPEYFNSNNRSELCDITCNFFEPLPNIGNGINLHTRERIKGSIHTVPKKSCLISTVLHKNTIEENNSFFDTITFVKSIAGLNAKSENASLENCYGSATCNDEIITTLKSENDSVLSKKRDTVEKLSNLNNYLLFERQNVSSLHNEIKIHERTKIVLEDPELNLSKLENLSQSTKQRQLSLEDQWRSYRLQLNEILNSLREKQQLHQNKNSINLQANIIQLEYALQEKVIFHNHLEVELKNIEHNSVNRDDYTKRINEFITNIRKQRNDISKVLDDTRDLQKQLNSVTSQLERQFNYTDDLLFQSAKHDIHAKKAYKLLASLHTECNELLKTVSLTGYILKETRDLGVNIDHEKTKNTAKRLNEITTDIQSFYNVIKSIKAEIRQVENEILYI